MKSYRCKITFLSQWPITFLYLFLGDGEKTLYVNSLKNIEFCIEKIVEAYQIFQSFIKIHHNVLITMKNIFFDDSNFEKIQSNDVDLLSKSSEQLQTVQNDSEILIETKEAQIEQSKKLENCSSTKANMREIYSTENSLSTCLAEIEQQNEIQLKKQTNSELSPKLHNESREILQSNAVVANKSINRYTFNSETISKLSEMKTIYKEKENETIETIKKLIEYILKEIDIAVESVYFKQLLEKLTNESE